MMASHWITSAFVVVSLTATFAVVANGCVGADTQQVSTNGIPAQFEVIPANRSLCQQGATVPPNRVNTTERLSHLRDWMNQMGVQAYLIVMTDEHGASSGTGYDARVAYISGFTGSNGWAVVTEKHAALWTDGRYFLQADQQMDCNWLLMKLGDFNYPQNTWDWLKDVLNAGSQLGAFPNIIAQSLWESHHNGLRSNGMTITAVKEELIDAIWANDERPPRNNNPLIVHTLDYAGETWQSKLGRVREKMAGKHVDSLVVNVLEQVAWLFNLRGTDRTSSLFYGYAIIENTRARLYVRNVSRLNTEEIQRHLNVSAAGSCVVGMGSNCVHVLEYDRIYDDVALTPPDNLIWVDPSANQAIYNASTVARNHVAMSPIELMKSVKNEVERRRFAECIARDSAAVVEFAAFLEKEIEAGRVWNEITAAEHLDNMRRTYTDNRGLSFETISAYGANAAVIHYRPSPETKADIGTSNVYLLDSGGQYLDGTTDVTRTFHYGTPRDDVKEAYTRVLMGQIDLAMTVWPEGLYGHDLDIRARLPLYKHGWDYNHGTGHGIGYFLSVHEGPGRINKGYSPTYEPLYRGMFFSDEPGYYEDNNFGIRLENLVTIVDANTPNRFGLSDYITFKTLTLVPYETKLIKYELLSADQITWLNEYNTRCLNEVGAYVRDIRNNSAAYDWIRARANTINPGGEVDASSTTSAGVLLMLFSSIVAFVVTM